MASELFGVKELNLKLEKLGRAAGIKVMRTALRKATRPVIIEMKARIPVGTTTHRTYRKRLVSPGYAKRSIRTVSGTRYISKGTISIGLGVKAEAWYAIRFLDQAPYTITRKRFGKRTKERWTAVKSYTLPKRPWFESTFRSNKNKMLSLFRTELANAIEKAVK